MQMMNGSLSRVLYKESFIGAKFRLNGLQVSFNKHLLNNY